MRRMGYFAPESERLNRFLIHDELQYYDLYDFKSFDEDNPAVVTVGDDKEEEKKEDDKDETKDTTLIKEKDEADKAADKDAEKKKEEENKASEDRLKKALGDVIAKFDVDYSAIKLDGASTCFDSGEVN